MIRSKYSRLNCTTQATPEKNSVPHRTGKCAFSTKKQLSGFLIAKEVHTIIDIQDRISFNHLSPTLSPGVFDRDRLS